MNILCYSHSSDQILKHYNEFIATDLYSEGALLAIKAKLCPFNITLISTDDVDLERVKVEIAATVIESISNAWKRVSSSAIGSASHQSAWERITQICDPIPLSKPWKEGDKSSQKTSPQQVRLLRFREGKLSNVFYLLLDRLELYKILPVYINFLINLWQVEQGNLPIHAAGVIRKDRLFLFAGRSGAGKSTIVSISESEYGQKLDEDQILIHQRNRNKFIANAWGYGTAACDAPVRAIFALIHSDEAKLVPLRQTQVAQLLLERYLEIVGMDPPIDLLRKSLRNAAEIARWVPGYELYFSKSPEFWKLIDERIPD